MTLESSRSLGHGVRVVPGDGGEIVVLSENLDLGWRPREDGRPGSVVMFDDEGYEVVARQPWGRGARWTLSPWSSEDVMRVVQPLNQAAVASLASKASAQDRAARLRPALWLLAPILGFADASWQRKWRDDWSYPAATATWISAILEMLFGAACVMEIIASAGAGASVFPWIPRKVVFFGLYFLVEGFVRLAQVFSDSEPVGSLFGAVIAIFDRGQPPPRSTVAMPKVECFDEESGILDLQSPVVRRDWEEPGILEYRGKSHVLDGTRQLGESWRYRFRRVEPSVNPASGSLRLSPPAPKHEPVARDEAPGLIKTVLLNIACTMAPARFQQRWAWWAGMNAIWFTVAGSLVELVGGLANLNSGAAGASVPLNLYFVAEAVTRLAFVILKREPLGSVFGLALAPILDTVLPD